MDRRPPPRMGRRRWPHFLGSRLDSTSPPPRATWPISKAGSPRWPDPEPIQALIGSRLSASGPDSRSHSLPAPGDGPVGPEGDPARLGGWADASPRRSDVEADRARPSRPPRRCRSARLRRRNRPRPAPGRGPGRAGRPTSGSGRSRRSRAACPRSSRGRSRSCSASSAPIDRSPSGRLPPTSWPGPGLDPAAGPELADSIASAGPLEVPPAARRLRQGRGGGDRPQAGRGPQAVSRPLDPPGRDLEASAGPLRPGRRPGGRVPSTRRSRPMPPIGGGTSKPSWRTSPAATSAEGRPVFNGPKAACVTCHAIGYVGGKLGPDLTKIGQVRAERDLLESIVYPSASFVRSYEPVSVATRDGQVVLGPPPQGRPRRGRPRRGRRPGGADPPRPGRGDGPGDRLRHARRARSPAHPGRDGRPDRVPEGVSMRRAIPPDFTWFRRDLGRLSWTRVRDSAHSTGNRPSPSQQGTSPMRRIALMMLLGLASATPEPGPAPDQIGDASTSPRMRVYVGTYTGPQEQGDLPPRIRPGVGSPDARRGSPPRRRARRSWRSTRAGSSSTRPTRSASSTARMPGRSRRSPSTRRPAASRP